MYKVHIMASTLGGNTNGTILTLYTKAMGKKNTAARSWVEVVKGGAFGRNHKHEKMLQQSYGSVWLYSVGAPHSHPHPHCATYSQLVLPQMPL